MSDKKIEDAEVAFWAAYAQMQHKLQDVTKSHENQAFKSGGKVSTYANLNDVLRECRPVWSEHGFAIVQNCRTVYYDNDKVLKMSIAIDTVVTHKQGHQETFTGLEVVVTNPNAHGIASAVTYGRRISLMPILGITGSDDDDDGNGATGTQGITGKKADDKKVETKPAKTAAPQKGEQKRVEDMTNDEVKAEFEGYAFSADDQEAMRLANITSQRIAIAKRREFQANADFLKSLGGA